VVVPGAMAKHNEDNAAEHLQEETCRRLLLEAAVKGLLFTEHRDCRRGTMQSPDSVWMRRRETVDVVSEASEASNSRSWVRDIEEVK